MGLGCTRDILVPLMTDNSNAPDKLLKMIRCNCTLGCSTLKCSNKKHGIECTTACGHCQNEKCDNIAYNSVSERMIKLNTDYWLDIICNIVMSYASHLHSSCSKTMFTENYC